MSYVSLEAVTVTTGPFIVMLNRLHKTRAHNAIDFHTLCTFERGNINYYKIIDLAFQIYVILLLLLLLGKS